LALDYYPSLASAPKQGIYKVRREFCSSSFGAAVYNVPFPIVLSDGSDCSVIFCALQVVRYDNKLTI
jgi:hypothetical protein